MMARAWMVRFADRPAAVNWRVALLISWGLILSAESPAYAEKRLALVIGNERYENISYVPKAEADVKVVAEKLTSLGFARVLVKVNANHATMSTIMEYFVSLIEPEDLALVYFVGNAIPIKAKNYLLPIDAPAARATQEARVAESAFPVESMVARLRDRGARVVFFIDASRDNPFDRPGVRPLELGTGLARFSQPPAMTGVLVSASPNERARLKTDGGDASPYSVFGRVLASQLGDLTIGELAANVQRQMREIGQRHNFRQTPVFYSNGLGVLYLSGRSSVRSGEGIQFKSKPDGSKRFTLSEIRTLEDELPAKEDCSTLGRKFGVQLHNEGGESVRFWVRMRRGDIGYCKRVRNDWLVESWDRDVQDAMVLEIGK